MLSPGKAGRAARSPRTHLHQRQVLHGGRAQRRGPFPHRVVAHPAVDAPPARVHPQAVLHAQVLCGGNSWAAGACWHGQRCRPAGRTLWASARPLLPLQPRSSSPRPLFRAALRGAAGSGCVPGARQGLRGSRDPSPTSARSMTRTAMVIRVQHLEQISAELGAERSGSGGRCGRAVPLPNSSTLLGPGPCCERPR